MLTISRENLIAAHSRQEHRRLFSRLAAYQIRRDDRRISRRLIHVPGQTWQQIDHIGLDHDLMVLAAQLSREALRNSWIVNRRLAHAIFFGKRNRVGPHRLLLRHGRHHGRNYARRIQPRTQKGADRNIAHHLSLDRCAEPRSDLVRQIVFCSFEAMLRRRER